MLPTAPHAVSRQLLCYYTLDPPQVWSGVRRQKFGDPERWTGVVLVMGVTALQHPLLHNQVRH